MRNICIIGGGPAGLMAAITAAESSKQNEIFLLERNEYVGKKLLATGNGRCNFSNLKMDSSYYNGANPLFVSNAIKAFSPVELKDFMASIGIEILDKEGLLYPRSQRASSVRNLLEARALSLGVHIRTGFKVLKVEKKQDFIISNEQESIHADKVIVCVGGMASPSTGSDGVLLRKFKEMGHTISFMRPACVPLKSNNPYCKALAGVRASSAVTLIKNGKTEKGEIQFTDYGISGICVFNISSMVELSDEVSVNLFPELDVYAVKELLNRNFERGGMTVYNSLIGLLNEKIVDVLLDSANCSKNTIASSLSNEQRQKLVELVTDFRFKITGFGSFDQAQVTKGGVSTSEINEWTMESRIVPGLYFAGEALDIDGPCGGYNIHWAFASGRMAGRAASSDTDISA